MRWVLVLVLVVALGVTGAYVASAQDANTLLYAGGRDAFGVDPHTSTLVQADAIITWNVYEGLIGNKKGSSDLVPALATSWTVSPDGLRYTFRLRPGVKFHDGTPFDAQAVVENVKRLQALNLGRARYVDPVASVQAQGPMVVVFQLKQRSVYFLQELPRVHIICPSTFTQHQVNGDWAHDWLNNNTCGTGPYRLVSWQKNDSANLEAFADYWNPDLRARPQRVIIKIVPDEAVRIQMLERGDADMVFRLSPDAYAQLQSMQGVQVLRAPSFDLTYAFFNTTRPALQRRDVREALVLAFPFDAMSRDVLRGFARVPTSALPRGIEGFDASEPPFQQDLARAKQLLDQAGIKPGQLSLKFIYVPGFEEIRVGAELWRDALGKLGVSMDISTTTFATLASMAAKPETAPDTTFLLGGTEVADPVSYLSTWGGSVNAGAQWNWSYFKNPTFDHLTQAAGQELDPKRRAQLLIQAQRLLRTELPFFPIYAPGLTEAMRTRVVGWQPAAADYHSIVRFYDLRLQK